jgi:hypothetical protein
MKPQRHETDERHFELFLVLVSVILLAYYLSNCGCGCR